MTNSAMINFDSENHETSYTSVNSVQCSTTISRSLPDLCSYVEDLQPQIATLDITSEDIDVPVKSFHSKLSLNNPKKVQFEDISSLKALSKTTGDLQTSVETSLTTKLMRKSSYNQCDFVFTENLSFSDQSSESSTLDGYFQDDSELNSSSDKLEFTDISLNEDESEEENQCSVNEISKVQSSKNGVLDSILDWVIPSNSSPKNKIVSHQSQAVSPKCSSGVPNCSKSSLSKNKMIFFRDKPIEPLSTTALILEDRPRNLPRKSLAESQKHRLEYKKMVEKARKNEAKKHEIRQRQLIKRLEHEESIANIGAQWQHEILPNWNLLYQTSRVRQLWWNGLPPNVRGKVWKLAIGNELNLTQDLYDIMVSRAHEKLRSMNESGTEDQESLTVDREDTVELIRLDISRTFPKLCIFQTGGPYHDILHDILGAYVCYRPDVGYVQGMSFIAAMLLLNMEPSEVFLTFANLLNKPCQIAFYRLNEGMMKTYFAAFEVFFEENLPRLFVHFKQSNLTPDMYLIDWVFTMFSKALSLDSACRVWDIFCRDGEEFIFKTAIGILKLHQNILLKMEFIHAAQFLIKLPVDAIDGQQLFDQILHLNMVSRGNRKWKDVLALLHNKEESIS